MEILLKMRSVPIKMEMEMTHARLEYKMKNPSVDIVREKGGLEIQTKRGQLHMDTYDARKSMGQMGVVDATIENGEYSMQVANQAVGQIVEDGNALAQPPRKGATIPDVAASKMFESTETITPFLPSVPVNISWEPYSVEFNYKVDKLNFNWKVYNKPEYEFIPGKIEYKVKEYAHVEFEFLGKPLYVPPSASPDYDPKLDVLA